MVTFDANFLRWNSHFDDACLGRSSHWSKLTLGWLSWLNLPLVKNVGFYSNQSKLMLANNVDDNGLAIDGKCGHDGLHRPHLHDPYHILVVSDIEDVLGQRTVDLVSEYEADLVALHGPRGTAVEDPEELPLRLHEDAGVAVPELGEVLLLSAG